ncbi:MAG: hypothetical protein MN733_36075 [Nitrososphaera sp.]|nr:hypothetical protein [Nitrososphaera sp.]
MNYEETDRFSIHEEGETERSVKRPQPKARNSNLEQAVLELLKTIQQQPGPYILAFETQLFHTDLSSRLEEAQVLPTMEEELHSFGASSQGDWSRREEERLDRLYQPGKNILSGDNRVITLKNILVGALLGYYLGGWIFSE